MTRLLSVLSLMCALVVTGCSNLPNQSKASISWPETLAEPAQLIDTLNADAIAYARIPSLSAWISAPKNNEMGELLATDANRAAVTVLLEALRQQLEPYGAEGAAAGLFLERMRSPLELAVRLPESTALTGAEVQASARFDFDSRSAFVQHLTALLQEHDVIRHLAAPTDDEPGRLSLGVMPAYYQFDPRTQRFTLSAGFASSAQTLAQLGREANPKHPALQRQAELEDSRYGLYVWANTEAIIPQVEPFMSAMDVRELDSLGVMGSQEFAFAIGSRAGKGQTTLLLRGEQGPLWDLALPDIPATRVRSLGEPDYYVSTVIPDEDWVRRLASVSDFSLRDLNQFTAKTGLDWTTLTAGLTGRVSFVMDDAGRYLALEPSDADAFAELLEETRYRGYTEITEYSTQNGPMHRLLLPLSGFWLGTEGPSASDWFMRSQDSQGWYYEQEGIWYFATVPQILLARLQGSPQGELASWSQPETDPPTLQFTGEVDSLVQANYHYYLEGLQTLAHMLDTEIDMLAFPVAEGSSESSQAQASLSLTYRQGTIRAVYGYETHPLDPLQGSMGSVAVIGILAAIAIPAYQDYVEQVEFYSEI